MPRIKRRGESLPWLVESRNRIQSLMLRLQAKPRNMTSPEWQLLVGAAFSLWRAVFLSHSTEIRTAGAAEAEARKFLRRVIEGNAITFGDDAETRVWSGGYYINNARYRLKLEAPDKFGRPLIDLWDEAFLELERRVAHRARRPTDSRPDRSLRPPL